MLFDAFKVLILILFIALRANAGNQGVQGNIAEDSPILGQSQVEETFQSKNIVYQIPRFPVQADGSLDTEALDIFEGLSLEQQQDFLQQRSEIFKRFTARLALFEQVTPALHGTNLGILKFLNLNLWRRAGRMVAPANKGSIIMLGAFWGILLGGRGEYRFEGWALSVFPRGPDGKLRFRIERHVEVPDRNNKLNFFFGAKIGLRFGPISENYESEFSPLQVTNRIKLGESDITDSMAPMAQSSGKGEFAMFPLFLNVFSSARQSSTVIGMTLNLLDLAIVGGIGLTATHHMPWMASALGVLLTTYTIASGIMGVYGDYSRELVMEKSFNAAWLDLSGFKSFVRNARYKLCDFFLRDL